MREPQGHHDDRGDRGVDRRDDELPAHHALEVVVEQAQPRDGEAVEEAHQAVRPPREHGVDLRQVVVEQQVDDQGEDEEKRALVKTGELAGEEPDHLRRARD